MANLYFRTANSVTYKIFQSLFTRQMSSYGSSHLLMLTTTTPLRCCYARLVTYFQRNSICTKSLLMHPNFRKANRTISSVLWFDCQGTRALRPAGEHSGLFRTRPLLSGSRVIVSTSLSNGLRTSSPRQVVPPLIAVLFVKPVAKLSAILGGRAFRNWWKGLPDNRRQHFYTSIRRNRYRIIGAVLGLVGLGSLYYYSHLQRTPITNRLRFIALTDSQFQKIAATEYENMKTLHADKSVSASHRLYSVIADIVTAITSANKDIKQLRDRTWKVHIVDKDLKNAFVLPNGEIFVFTGMLKAVSNEQQLAAVLAHEIAHVVLNHGAEQVSFSTALDFLLILVLAALWILIPNDGIALIATWFKDRVAQLLLNMPYSRKLENEADEVGLILAAKSCFDVRECQAFWDTMALEEDVSGVKDVEWLSTHPTHSNRADKLEALLPQAMELRKLCDCPPLPKADPRLAVQSRRSQYLESLENKQEEPAVMAGIKITVS